MAGNKAGAAKKLAYLIEQFGSLELAKEARRKQMAAIGSTGGKASSGYKFAHGKVSPVEAGKKSSNKTWWKTELERRKGGAE